MDAKDVYQLRAEEFERNFESIRGIEWRTAIEVFTGYAIIALAYYHLHDKHPSSCLLGLGAVMAILILFFSNLYLSLRIQERLHFTHAMRNEYYKKLHDLCEAPMLDIPPGVKEPKHKKWWAFAIQMLLSITAMLLLLIYVMVTTPWCCGG
jgi:hypothetical protein